MSIEGSIFCAIWILLTLLCLYSIFREAETKLYLQGSTTLTTKPLLPDKTSKTALAEQRKEYLIAMFVGLILGIIIGVVLALYSGNTTISPYDFIVVPLLSLIFLVLSILFSPTIMSSFYFHIIFTILAFFFAGLSIMIPVYYFVTTEEGS
jgi:hypothetical protein